MNRKIKKLQNRHLPELKLLDLGTYFTAPFQLHKAMTELIYTDQQ